jgi:signal transduction histidine kinase
MAATVAHEIRNPLGGIASFANLLERDLETDDPSRRLVRKITEGVARLNRIVSSLLSYTRPLNLNTHPVDLMQTVEEAAAFFEIDLERKQQAVEIRRLFLETPCVCQVDTEQFHQVILNLLLNATQAMPEGGTIELEVAQTSDADGDWIVTRVRDTGMGIDEELQEKLFTPFFTTKEDGTGLGLVTSRKIIEAHGGTIVVDSTPGDGTCFTIALPL